MKWLSTHDREGTLDYLKNNQFDLLVIGGGITGCGIALDAASRGLKTALVERDDFASGTSSRSTKLIHGGLRYLKQFEIMLVREMGRERAVLNRLAPHLVRSEKMLLPIMKEGTLGKFTTSVGLMVYDLLAGVESEDQRQMLDREETLAMEPLLESEDLEGAAVYAEYRTDDARLTIEVMKTAVSYGAVCMNYLTAEDFLYNDKKVAGIKARDVFTKNEFEINARYVVNAAGPWVDELRSINNSLEGKRVHLSKGVHIVVPKEKFPLQTAVYFDSHDERMVFAIPRGAVTYIGTTDTDFQGSPSQVLAEKEDVTYLLKAVNRVFKTVDLVSEDVISSWAGLRPLIHEEGKDVGEMSRKDEVFISGSGLVSIAGGKLTGYRKMAEKIIDTVLEMNEDNGDSFHGLKKECITDDVPLTENAFAGEQELKTYQRGMINRLKDCSLSEEDAFYLVSNYGRQCEQVLDLLKEIEGKDVQLSLLKAEALFTIDRELVNTLADLFVRRTGRLYFNIDSVKKCYKTVADFMAKQLKWDKKRKKREIEFMEELICQAGLEVKE